MRSSRSTRFHLGDYIPDYEMSDGETPGFRIGAFKSYGVSRTQKFSTGIPHRHAHFEIFWITGGEGVALRDGERIRLRPKTLFFLNPGEVHAWVTTRDMSGILLQFSSQFIATFDTVLPVPMAPYFWRPKSLPTLNLDEAEQKTVSEILTNMCEDAQSGAPQKENFLKAHLFLFFNKARQYCLRRSAMVAKPKESATTLRFQAAVQTSCPPLVTVKQFAESLGVSRSFLHRTVSRDTGQMPSALIHERLIVEAKRRLLHTRSDLSEIARELGFGDASYFGRFFLRHADMTPHRFRQHQLSSASG